MPPALSALPGNPIIDSAAFAAIVAYLLSLVKPYVEALPFAHPGRPLHDATIRLLNLLLNIALVVAAYAVNGPLTLQSAWLYGFQGLAQAVASDHLYNTLSGASSSSSASDANAAPITPIPVPAPDLSAQKSQLAAEVASAITATLAQQQQQRTS